MKDNKTVQKIKERLEKELEIARKMAIEVIQEEIDELEKDFEGKPKNYLKAKHYIPSEDGVYMLVFEENVLESDFDFDCFVAARIEKFFDVNIFVNHIEFIKSNNFLNDDYIVYYSQFNKETNTMYDENVSMNSILSNVTSSWPVPLKQVELIKKVYRYFEAVIENNKDKIIHKTP